MFTWTNSSLCDGVSCIGHYPFALFLRSDVFLLELAHALLVATLRWCLFRRFWQSRWLSRSSWWINDNSSCIIVQNLIVVCLRCTTIQQLLLLLFLELLELVFVGRLTKDLLRMENLAWSTWLSLTLIALVWRVVHN